MRRSQQPPPSGPAQRPALAAGWRLWSVVRTHRRLLAWIITMALTGNLLALLGPWLNGLAIDQMPGPDQVLWRPLIELLLVLATVYLLSSFSQWLLARLTSRLTTTVIHDLRQAVNARLTELPLRFLDNHAHGDLASRMNQDMEAVGDGLVTGLAQLFGGLLTLIGSVILMIRLNAWIALVIVVLTPVSFRLAALIASRSQRMFRCQSRTTGELTAYASEIISNLALIQAFRHEQASTSHLEALNQKLYREGQKAQFYSSLTNPTTRLVNNLAYLLVAVVASLLAVAGHLSVGIIASFLGYAAAFARPINDITSVTTQLQAALASASRVFTLLDQPPEPVDLPGTLELQVTTGAVEFRRVDFAYNPAQPLIHQLDLLVEAGSLVAIVGPTGAGKTTLVNLLLRFYELNAGQILIDGQDIATVSRVSLRRAFGMVLQDTWLFTGTIRENLLLARPAATQDEIEQATRAARADRFIRRLPQGYDTVIGPQTDQLSAGQRQLLTIARALLADPPFLILDEATSSVDTRTEIQIQRAFRTLLRGRTSFVIAHRLSTIREADQILVLAHGQIVERGCHTDLLAAGGYYARLYASQFAGQDIDYVEHTKLDGMAGSREKQA